MINNRVLLVCGLLVGLAGCGKKAQKIVPKKETAQLSAFFDVRPTAQSVSYLYSPGFQNTELVLGRYCPSFTAATGEKITWKSGAHVFGEPHSCVIFPEIDLRKPTYRTLNPITALVNGIRRDLAPLAQRVMQDTLDFKVESNANSCLSIVNYSFDFSKANLAQKADINALRKTYKRHIHDYPGSDVVLYGDSRGAATIFNFLALHQPTQVKAAVMEGMFDDLSHVVKHFLYTDKKACEEKRLYDIARFVVSSYKKNGASPRKSAEIISDDVPLLMVISLKDGLVSPQCTMYLYNRLYERGHKKTHLLVLKKSRHPAYMVEDADDKQLYESTVHAFYKHYNLPHNSALAARGAQSFALTQPTPAFLQRTYQLPQCPLCNTVCTIKHAAVK